MNELSDQELYYLMALTNTAFIGDKTARVLLEYFGSAEEVFKVPARRLAAIGGLGEKRVQSLKSAIDSGTILQEIEFIKRHNIRPLHLEHSLYPQQLKACADAPVLLYYKGNADLNAKRMVAVIGTRKNTDYGRQLTEELIEDLQGEQVTVVSGLAFGIDVYAHKKAIACNTPTIGVMAHGLDRIYPSAHKGIAKEIVMQGGLLTEYPSGTLPDKQNFPMRNRIVAGMSAVTVVVETGIKGGAMITARLASDYNKEVAAFPGRTTDSKSAGCNELIRSHIAHMIGNAGDLMDLMSWKTDKKKEVVQPELFSRLTGDALQVVRILEGSEGMGIDELLLKSGTGSSMLASVLLGLELEGVLRLLPGKRYRLK